MHVSKKATSTKSGHRSRVPATRPARDANGAMTQEAKSFSTTFTVRQSPQEVYDAINDVRGWWSGEIEGYTDRIGAEFTYRYKGLHRSTQRITELVPGKRVVWHVVDASLDFVEDRTEWNGTDIVFEIGRKGETTEVRFTHLGLAPRFQCYGNCSGAWRYYINDSLRSLIATGTGEPNPKGS
jgi:uncharacterized protein YndB with AHSA1/START domain